MKIKTTIFLLVILSIVTSNISAQADPSEYLTHSWTFDDDTENDYVGGANGVLMGGAYIADSSLFTDLGNSWMEMPADSIAMNTYEEVTVEAWVIPAAGQNTGYTMLTYFGNSVNGLGSNGYFISIARGDNKSRTAISCGDISTPWASESGADGPELDDGLVHHLVSTLTDTNITFYIDGELQASTTLSETNDIEFISDSLAYLAKGGYTADPTWLGEILEASIYNKALTAEEVHFLYHNGPVPVPVDPLDYLTHSWTFDDDTENDYVGGANGTLMGGAYIADSSLFTDLGNSWMEMPADSIAMNTYEEVTVEAWVIPAAGQNTGFTMLTYFGNSVNGLGSNGYFISIARGDNKSRAAISCNDISTPWASESGADGPELDDGLLHHLVSTLSDTNITLYIDGELQASTTLSETNDIEFISDSLAYLAKGGYTADPTWLGEILEVNIYNKALSAEDVFLLYLKKGDTSTVSVNDITSLPIEYSLLQNYPNPFNPATNISFELPARSNVRIAVYNLLGQELAILVDEVKPAGRHMVRFDGSNLSSGMYITRMEVDNQLFTNKMLLLK